MSSDQVATKREVMLAFLEHASVFVHLDPRRADVVVPQWFKRQPQLVLQVGLNMPVPIRDLEVGQTALTCTLSFNRSPFWCCVPWTSVFGLVCEDGQGRLWPDDVPVEVAAQIQAQQKPEPRVRGRSKLRAVSSTTPSIQDSADEAALAQPLPAAVNPSKPEPDERAPETQPSSAGRGVANPEPDRAGHTPKTTEGTPKRERPPYLRLVK